MEMVALGVVTLAMAAIAGYGYVDTKRRVDVIESRETVSPWQATSGPVAVAGTVELAGVDPIHAPLTGEQAVLVDWERDENPDDDDDEMTTTGQSAVDFTIAGQRGQVRIRPKTPDAVTVSSSARTTEYVPDADRIDGDLLERLETFDAERRDDEGFYDLSSSKISQGLRRESGSNRFTQEVLKPGDDCYVVGEAHRDETGELVVEDGGNGPFLLSDMDESSLADHYGGNQTLLLIVAVGLLAVAGVAFAVAAGIL